MPLFGRSDGDLVRDLAPVRRIIPYLMSTRMGAVVFHDTVYDVAEARRWLDTFNAARPDAPKATLFHLFLFACARALHERPGLNRFVSGGRIYQRRDVTLSFAAKRGFSDDEPIVTRKLRFDRGEAFEDAVRRIIGGVRDVRAGKEDRADKEVKLALLLPGFLLSLGVKLLMWLDRVNLLPRSMIEPDPMYASLFAANLGSVGLDRVTHHLYEYGTVSLFGAMGVAGPRVVVGADGAPEVRDTVEVRWSFDERINDGFYCAASLGIVKETLENPTRILGDPGATGGTDASS
jgi:pyruvate/2-oxoglutarate dehydrogenase complex dihydrolipoamide acyltransferase (E2) component